MSDMVTVVLPAKLVFDPPEVSKKHKRQRERKVVACALFDVDIVRYYGWFIKKRFGLPLVLPLRGGHVSFINDMRADLKDWNSVKSVFNGKTVSVMLDLNVRSDGHYWWLPVSCADFDTIRESLGLGNPYFNYHMTIGYCNNKVDSYYASEYLRC